MKVFVPVAGESPFFPQIDFPFPKPLIEVRDKMMIAHVVENLRELSPEAEFVFIALQEEAARYSYESIFSLITDGRARTVQLRSRTAGALCSCLMAIEHIDLERPLVIANSDQVIDEDLSSILERFDRMGADAGILSFTSTHPRWSYVRVENDNRVVEASEKRVISKTAIAGFYYFRRGADFIDAAFKTILMNDSVEGTFFVAPSLNQLILQGKDVRSIQIGQENFHSFYLPAQITAFERLESRKSSARPQARPLLNVLIPAAGEGSRFAREGWTAPKPFIDVMGCPMIEHVTRNVSIPGSRFIGLVRRQQLESFPEAKAIFERLGGIVEPVEALTEGTACTVLLARRHIDDDTPLLIANSDQLVDFECADFIADAQRRGLDGSILVFRDKTMDPKWSFAAVDANGLVTRVAEKVAISDLATVGIYYFAKGREFVAAAVDMIARNERVNNEFYTCPVYNYMIRAGLRIGVYEVPAAAMAGLGTPSDLLDFIAQKGGHPSRHAPLAAAEGR